MQFAGNAAQQQPGQQAQYQCRSRAAKDHRQGDLQVAGKLPHQQAEHSQRQAIDQPTAARHGCQVPAQDAQRGDLAQAQQWRQGKAEQRTEPGCAAHQQGRQPRLGQAAG